jgi:sulfur transfer complex TusBCD TusB component (DsrH family)
MPTDRFHCLQCELEEEQCTCDKYCALCMTDSDVRLCQDGVFYCRDCREACDYTAQTPKH